MDRDIWRERKIDKKPKVHIYIPIYGRRIGKNIYVSKRLVLHLKTFFPLNIKKVF